MKSSGQLQNPILPPYKNISLKIGERVSAIIVLYFSAVLMIGAESRAAVLEAAKPEARQVRSDSVYEVFPLAPKLQYLYHYRNHYVSYQGDLRPWVVETDTGTVEYTILDSAVVSDSIVNWSIREVSVLWDSSRVGYDSVSDSTVIDTVLLTLQESLAGLRRLRVHGELWDFPSPDSVLQVYRYSDTPGVTLTHSWFLSDIVPSGFVGGEDSIVFRSAMGPTSITVSRSPSFSPMFTSYSDGSASLDGSPVLGVEPASRAAAAFVLYQNYPNPFNPATTITYELQAMYHVTLRVYDVLGREVATPVDENEMPGRHAVRFDGAGLPSGVYLYRLRAGDYSITKKFILLK